MKKNIPNILTILRFFLIPVILYFLSIDNFILAFVFLCISGLTDILDGFIARKYNLITNFGKLVDPLADKLTLASILVALYLKNILPIWILAIVILKEFVMIAGASFLYGKELVVSSKWYGKAATVIFYIAILSSLVIRQFKSGLNFDKYIYYAALFMTIFSLIMYFRSFYVQGYLKKENLKISK